MKKIIFVFLVLLNSICAMAQQTFFVKISNGLAYYRLERVGKKTLYYKQYAKAKDLFDFTNTHNISKKKYEAINVEEQLLSDLENEIINPSRIDNSDIELDDRTILATPMRYISTSSNFDEADVIKGFEVKKCLDSNLIGCCIICEIVEKRKSNITGSEGRLIIRPLYVEKKDGSKVRLIPTDIIKRGLNRSNVKFWTSFLIAPVFVPGSRAEIKKSEMYEFIIEK